ncbi:protein FAM210B, mitochondrial-like [Paramacrobiotus metropolitanus]|uniref:protein FAM210B, mitochondrial-like n=1 Tax=Paramacrobiotus metropolitanus TaxID=2943436 RepID=UPI002445A978|nr:protein FAM210B, mitochondrial-like [Paramacrobiotus metropolitanus]XP_055329157.1 protein FAM210B, mitochondrial-like [Paramacrobiotus metropolitanus]
MYRIPRVLNLVLRGSVNIPGGIRSNPDTITMLTSRRSRAPSFLKVSRFASSSAETPAKTPSTTDPPLAEGTPSPAPKTSREKLKAAIRDYGSTVLVFHIASGVSFLGMWYLLISSGVDVTSVIKTFGLEGTLGKYASGAGTFVVAYAIHKATAPLRIALTLTVSPLIVNYLRRKGFMKIKS